MENPKSEQEIGDSGITLPTWIEQLKPAFRDEVDELLRQYGLSESGVRKILQAWTERNIFGRKRLDFGTVPCSVRSHVILEIKQLRHHEVRNITTKIEPDTEQSYEREQHIEGLWESRRIEKFKTGSAAWVLSGSGKASVCERCEGKGKVTCAVCQGDGQLTCPTCRGTGIVQCYKCSGRGILRTKCPNCRGRGFVQISNIVGGTTRGGPGAGVVLTKEQCIRCGATGYLSEKCGKCGGDGRLTCSQCGGAKLVRCRTCAGSGNVGCAPCGSSGRVYSYDQVSATSRVLRQTLWHGVAPAMKKSWFARDKASKPRQFDIDGSLSIEGDLSPAPKEGRILYERYYVRAIPVSSVLLKSGKEYELFVVGNEHRLYRCSPLLDLTKIGVFGAILVAVATAALVLLV